MNKRDGGALRPICLLACALVAALAVAACGSSNHSGGAGSSTSSSSMTAAASSGASSSKTAKTRQATGSPITLGMIADVGTDAVNVYDEVAAARAGVRQINTLGGINGHRVVLDFCNEALNPNTAESCARKMVSKHVMAMVADSVVTAEGDVNKIFDAAGIPQVATISYSGVSLSDPNTYMDIGDELYSIAAQMKFAAENGDKRVAMARYQSPIADAYPVVAKSAAQQVGADYVGSVDIPGTFSDLSTQAAALIALKPQAVSLECSPAAALALIKEMDGLGYTGKFFGDGGYFTQAQIESLGSTAESQQEFSTPMPLLGAKNVPGISIFLSAIKAEQAAGDKDALSGPALVIVYDEEAWLGVRAIQEIANKYKATTAPEFKKALHKAKNVYMFGMTPPWTPDAEPKANPPALARVNNSSYYEARWQNGAVNQLDTKPVDIGPLVNKALAK